MEKLVIGVVTAIYYVISYFAVANVAANKEESLEWLVATIISLSSIAAGVMAWYVSR